LLIGSFGRRLLSPSGKLILTVVNFLPRRIADFEYEFLLLGNNEVVLVQPDCDVLPGERAL
jgi:hypothetical protein